MFKQKVTLKYKKGGKSKFTKNISWSVLLKKYLKILHKIDKDIENLSLSNPKYWQMTKYCKETYEKPPPPTDTFIVLR